MIKNISQIDQTLRTGNVRDWAKSAEGVGAPFDAIETPGIERSGGTKTFGEFLQDSLAQVNGLQQEANTAMQKLASGESKDLHETLLTVEKAEIAFKAMNQVRGKVIEAYKEIMRMQI